MGSLWKQQWGQAQSSSRCLSTKKLWRRSRRRLRSWRGAVRRSQGRRSVSAVPSLLRMTMSSAVSGRRDLSAERSSHLSSGRPLPPRGCCCCLTGGEGERAGGAAWEACGAVGCEGDLDIVFARLDHPCLSHHRTLN
jgi:hypothetical protein